ncbi:MAG: glycosyltransferase family 39 protein [Lentisphaeria bacterium]|nr:glycosyltransferase family 39 protein [Lentisphaeria bacterium]
MTDRDKKYFLLLALFAGILLFCGLGARELFSGDETRVAGIMAEMVLDGDPVVPRLNGRPFLEYPPLYYQAGSVCLRLFGFTDGAAKLPGAAAVFCAVLVLYALARKLAFPPPAALAAGIVFLTGAQIFRYARKCMVDAMLASFVLLAVFAFYAMTQSRDRRARAGFFLLYAAGLAGGVMTKGLVGFAFPWAGLGVWLILDDVFFEKKFTFPRYLLLGLGAVPALVPVLGWGYLLYLREGKAALHTVFVTNGIGRFSGSQGDHVENFWFYFKKLPAFFQPYLIFFLLAMVHAVLQLRRKRLPRGMLLPFACAAAPFAMLCVSSAKRQVYLLPVYSAWALMTAWYVFDRRQAVKEAFSGLPQALRRKLLPCAGAAAAAVSLVFLVLTPGWTKLLPAAGLLLTAAALFGRRRRNALLILALAAEYVCIDTAVLSRKNAENSLRPLFEVCRRAEKENCRIALQSPPERTSGAAVFYMKKTLPVTNAGIPTAPDERRIARSRTPLAGIPFADDHYLLGPGNGKKRTVPPKIQTKGTPRL